MLNTKMSVHFSEWSDAWSLERHSFLDGLLSEKTNPLTETEKLSKIPPSSQPFVLQQMFNLSQIFGTKLQKGIERPFTLTEAIDLLSHMGLACFCGDWKKESSVFSKFLYRGECKSSPLSFCCDYWKVNAQGLLKGVAPDIEFTRHQSIGHGNLACLDYAYLSPMVHREYGVVPPGLRHLIEKLIKKMNLNGISIDLKGLNEEQLYVEIEGTKFPLDRERRELALHLVQDTLAESLPHLVIQDQNNSSSFYSETNPH